MPSFDENALRWNWAMGRPKIQLGVAGNLARRSEPSLRRPARVAFPAAPHHELAGTPTEHSTSGLPTAVEKRGESYITAPTGVEHREVPVEAPLGLDFHGRTSVNPEDLAKGGHL